ncbi:uncharacterized protein LOC135936376 [Cloeon dipterum]|uniref:uncharacterized protein LOC135936376 n=1 Tax=Cloeon dipterum TaxID=197152 RepID=UPI00321FFA16
MNDLVIDETPNGTFSYITMLGGQHIAVFSLEKNQSWVVETPGIVTYSIALTPKEEARKLYLSNVDSNELYSVSVAALRKGTRTANPILIGKWNARPYKMLMDNHGTMYAAFLYQNYTSSWNTSQPFEEQRFYEVAGQKPVWPFTFALDESENLWMTMFDDDTNKSRYRLVKAAVDAKSFKASPELPSLFHQYRLIILICSIVFCVVLLSLIILWLILRQKRNNHPLTQNTNEAQQLSVYRDEQAEVQDEDSRSAAAPLSVPDVGPDEEQCKEFIYDQVAATPPSPGLFEQQICLSSRSARRVRVLPPLPPRPTSFEKFGAAPHAPVEYDDVGPAQPEHLYDDVAP